MARGPRLAEPRRRRCHFPWVHPGILGDRAKPLSPEHEVRDDGRTILFDIALEEPGASVKGDAAPGTVVQREPTTYTLHLPLSVTLDQHLPRTTASSCSSPARR